MGNALAIGLRQGLVDAGVPVHYETELTDLLIEDGRVVGVHVVHHGSPTTIRARRGVILGSGGFEKNLEMREKYQPQPTSDRLDHRVGQQHRRRHPGRDRRRRPDRPARRRLVGTDDPAAVGSVVLPGRAQPARLDHRERRRPTVHERGHALRRGGARDLRRRGHRSTARPGLDGHRPALPQPLPLRRALPPAAVPGPLVQERHREEGRHPGRPGRRDRGAGRRARGDGASASTASPTPASTRTSTAARAATTATTPTPP